MGYFKFLDPQWAEVFLHGSSVRLGNLNYFRMLELVHDSAWIGDRFDGSETYVAANLDSRAPADDKLLRETRFFAGDGNITVGRMIIHQDSHGFILSLAHGEYADLSEQFAKERDGIPGYSACVEIVDIGSFVGALAKAKICAPGTALHDRVVEDCMTIECGCVRYQPHEHDFRTTQVSPASPFAKRDVYSHQREFRIVFTSSPTVFVDAIYLSADIPEGCLSLVSGGDANTPRAQSAALFRSRDDAVSSIKQAFEALDRIAAPDYGLVQRGEMAWEEYSQANTKYWQTLEDTFDREHRRKALEAYWYLRDPKPSPRLDHAFIRQEGQMQMRRYLFEFLDRIGVEVGHWELTGKL